MLFVTALPIAATASAVFNIVKYKATAFKMLYVVERPVPLGCEDIGTWFDFLDFDDYVSFGGKA